MTTPVLSVRGLRVLLGDAGAPAVDGLDFDLHPGEVLGLVGESGCGKTKTAEALLGLVPPSMGRVTAERLELCGQPLLGLREPELRRLRGRRIAMVFQESMSALDPVFTAGAQVGAVLRRHRGLNRREARRETLELLRRMGFDDPARAFRSYPHELSGGMRQRVAIAMAMAGEPRVLVADEPTTALDVTTQAQVLDLLARSATAIGAGVLLITHDLGVVAHYCDRALVMRAGRCVEQAPTAQLFEAPAQEYTARLLAAARGEQPA